MSTHDDDERASINITSINQSGGQTAHTIVNQAPRRNVDAHAANVITGHLRANESHRYVIVDYAGGQDLDTHQFAQQLDAILAAGGWARHGELGWFLPVGGAPVVGVHFLFHSQKVPAAAGELWRAFNAGGIEIRTQESILFPALIPEDSLVGLAIGRAP